MAFSGEPGERRREDALQLPSTTLKSTFPNLEDARQHLEANVAYKAKDRILCIHLHRFLVWRIPSKIVLTAPHS